MNEAQALIEGAMYRITQRIPGVWNTPRESCMKLIGRRDDYGIQVLIFSARPRFGTQEVNLRDITELEIQPPDAQVYINWKVGSRGSPEKWDYER